MSRTALLLLLKQMKSRGGDRFPFRFLLAQISPLPHSRMHAHKDTHLMLFPLTLHLITGLGNLAVPCLALLVFPSPRLTSSPPSSSSSRSTMSAPSAPPAPPPTPAAALQACPPRPQASNASVSSLQNNLGLPLAAGPDIMLSWEKDSFYAKQIHTQLKVRLSLACCVCLRFLTLRPSLGSFLPFHHASVGLSVVLVLAPFLSSP